MIVDTEAAIVGELESRIIDQIPAILRLTNLLAQIDWSLICDLSSVF